MLKHMLQVSQELLQQGVQQLYEGYRLYAINTPPAWMQAVDAAAVRQVQMLAGSVWHPQPGLTVHLKYGLFVCNAL